MDNKVALIIFFNHNYQKNIEKLKQIYQERFDNIYFVIPFYEGEDPHIIPVYDNSHYFHGFLATAANRLKQFDFEKYFFVADDVLLNPKINQHNFKYFFSLEAPLSSFIANHFLLSNPKEKLPHRTFAPFWNGIPYALKFSLKVSGFELQRYLPSYQEAIGKLHANGLVFIKAIPKRIFFPRTFPRRRRLMDNLKELYHFFRLNIKHLKYLFCSTNLKYPLVGGYSDIVIVDKSAIQNFAKYSHAFAAANLFVEIAAPTALLLASEKVVTEKDAMLKPKTYWYYDRIEKNCMIGISFKNILNEFPADTLYIHPIKLSEFADE